MAVITRSTRMRRRLPRRRARWLMTVAVVLLALAMVGILTVALINTTVKRAGGGRILPVEEAAALAEVDTVLVLGAGVKADGSPTDMLRDRILTGVALVDAGTQGTLLMSGDNRTPDYDEVSAMVRLATEKGIGEERIATDRLGLSTYESLVRAKELYGAKTVIIITQEYHLYRALYIAEQLGLDAYGVSADLHTYRGQTYRDLREVAARCKDFLVLLFD